MQAIYSTLSIISMMYPTLTKNVLDSFFFFFCITLGLELSDNNIYEP